jgi:hypothetical protein
VECGFCGRGDCEGVKLEEEVRDGEDYGVEVVEEEEEEEGVMVVVVVVVEEGGGGGEGEGEEGGEGEEDEGEGGCSFEDCLTSSFGTSPNSLLVLNFSSYFLPFCPFFSSSSLISLLIRREGWKRTIMRSGLWEDGRKVKMS